MGISTSCQGGMQANTDTAAHGMNTTEVQLWAHGVFRNTNQCGWDLLDSCNLYLQQMRRKTVYYWAASGTN